MQGVLLFKLLNVALSKEDFSGSWISVAVSITVTTE